MNEVTEHVFPTIGRNIEDYEYPVLTGCAREEIIRCKDCDYYTIKSQTCWCYPEAIYKDPNGFCDEGVRKETR